MIEAIQIAYKEIDLYKMKENKDFWKRALTRDIQTKEYRLHLNLKLDCVILLFLNDVTEGEILSMSFEECFTYLYLFL